MVASVAMGNLWSGPMKQRIVDIRAFRHRTFKAPVMSQTILKSDRQATRTKQQQNPGKRSTHTRRNKARNNFDHGRWWWLFPCMQGFWGREGVCDEQLSTVLFFSLLFSGDQLVHTNSTLQASISPQWLSKLSQLWPNVP